MLVFVHARGRGRGSGLEMDNRMAWVWTFRGDKAVRLVVYEEQAEALEAVGLAAWAMSQAQKNLEVVRSIYAAWGRGDFSWVGWAHPEIEYVIVEGRQLMRSPTSACRNRMLTPTAEPAGYCAGDVA